MDLSIPASVWGERGRTVLRVSMKEFSRRSFSGDDFLPYPGKEHIDIQMRASIGYWEDAWRRFRQNRVALVSVMILAVLAFMSIIGPMISGYGFDAVSLIEKNRDPSMTHWFGTDSMGRDLFTRVWKGGRISLTLGAAGAIIDTAFGAVYGGIAAYAGGKTDMIMMRIVEILACIPHLILVVMVSLIVGRGMGSLLVAMCLSG